MDGERGIPKKFANYIDFDDKGNRYQATSQDDDHTTSQDNGHNHEIDKAIAEALGNDTELVRELGEAVFTSALDEKEFGNGKEQKKAA